MSGIVSPPAHCLLCSSNRGLVSPKFTHLYPQNGDTPYLLYCWECLNCRGWFVHPIPEPAVIGKYWQTVAWADSDSERRIADKKRNVLSRILERLSCYTEAGPLLDFGCNFGQFLIMARQAGWHPIGFEPSEEAAEIARSKGFDVQSGWSFDQANFLPDYFAAITAVDSFYYVWDPVTVLRAFLRLLKPGGVLAMRITNKRLILGLARAVLPFGQTRDQLISKILQGQFHSISLSSLKQILEGIGFERPRIEPRAMTSTWQAASLRTKFAYFLADVMYRCSFTAINLSPGVLLFATKKKL